MTLSKQSWIGGILLAVFGFLTSGFFGSVGSDLYNQLKMMVAGSPFTVDFMTVFIIFITVGMGLGIALIVHDIYKQRHKLPKGAFHPTFSGLETNPDKIDKDELKRRQDDWRFFPSNYK